jgi:hypothetical protein
MPGACKHILFPGLGCLNQHNRRETGGWLLAEILRIQTISKDQCIDHGCHLKKRICFTKHSAYNGISMVKSKNSRKTKLSAKVKSGKIDR